METPISEIRREYSKGKLTQCTIHDNPFEQFVEWLDDAIIHKEDEPTAMICLLYTSPSPRDCS